jgi:hypothetical protein
MDKPQITARLRTIRKILDETEVMLQLEQDPDARERTALRLFDLGDAAEKLAGSIILELLEEHKHSSQRRQVQGSDAAAEELADAPAWDD